MRRIFFSFGKFASETGFPVSGFHGFYFLQSFIFRICVFNDPVFHIPVGLDYVIPVPNFLRSWVCRIQDLCHVKVC